MERYCATSRSFCDGALSKAEGVKRKGSGMIERRFFFFFFLKESKSWKREAVSAFLLQHTHKSHVMRHGKPFSGCFVLLSRLRIEDTRGFLTAVRFIWSLWVGGLSSGVKGVM